MQTAKLEHMERATSCAVGSNTYALTTTTPLARVLSEGWLNRFSEMNMRRGDRIMVTANLNAEIETDELLVLENLKGLVTWRQLP